MFCGFVVDFEGQRAKCGGVSWANGLFDSLIGDVFVVAARVDFRSGGEDGFGQAIGFSEAGRQFDAADRAGLLVVFPSGSRDIAAHDTLYRKHFGSLDEHATAGQLIEKGLEFAGKLRCVCGDEVVRDDGLEEVEPEERELGENLPFVGYSAAKDMVEGGDAVAGDEEELIAGESVDVAHLAACCEGKAAEIGFEKCC